MKNILRLILKLSAKAILARYHPDIIGITGSVGKTSAKEAVFAVLSHKQDRIRQNIKNYNNEIGLPLTIIGSETAGRNWFGWMRIFFKAFMLIIKEDKTYPRIMILEMGIDRPGDMEYLSGIVKCRIGIETMIGPAHLQYFGTVDRIIKEKEILLNHLLPGGWAVVNYDNIHTRQMAAGIKHKSISYGLDAKADVRAQEADFSYMEGSLQGISFKLAYNGSFVPVLLPGALSSAAVYAALAGACVGIIYGMNLVEISQALREFILPPGRMRLISGQKGTLIADDSYNASPQSMLSALENFKKIPATAGSRKWAVLGDMLELGLLSESSHLEAGRLLAKLKIDRLITVGELAQGIGQGALKQGMGADNIFCLADPVTAGKLLAEKIQAGDMILVKGSQAARMEKVVHAIMAEPEKAGELLARQEGRWARS